MKKNKLRSELMCDGDTGEWGIYILLATKSEGAAKIKALRLIRKFNNALKPRRPTPSPTQPVKKD